jgi:hypothetical protein
MIARPRLLPLLLSLSTVAACGYTERVHSERDPKADFASLRTYAWLAKKPEAPQDPRFDNDVVSAQVRKSANGVLQAKGYALASGAEPDFLIAWRVTTKDIPGDDQIPNYWGYFPIYQGGIGFYTSPVEEGTLVIDVIDAKSKVLIWRGLGERQVVELDSPEDRLARMRSGVAKVMQQFPQR